MLCCHPAFRPLLTPFDAAALERHAGSVLGLFHDNTIAYLNPAWFHFAFENGGEPAVPARWGLGAPMMSAISRSLLPFYMTAFSECRRTRLPWEHSYECSSADVFRQFHMKVYPLRSSGELLVVHSLAAERPHQLVDRQAHAAVKENYRDILGFVAQCGHCRRVQHARDRDRWDWVPDWVRQPPANLRDAFCPICRDYYYPAK